MSVCVGPFHCSLFRQRRRTLLRKLLLESFSFCFIIMSTCWSHTQDLTPLVLFLLDCLCHLYSLAPFSTASHVVLLCPCPYAPVSITTTTVAGGHLHQLIPICVPSSPSVVGRLLVGDDGGDDAAQNRTEEQNTKTLRISNQFQ